MSKYLGGAATGRVQAPTSADQIKSNIIPEAMKQELVRDLQNEQKKKVDFQDFSLKEISAAESKRKEQALVEAIKKGTMAAEVINGELKLQIEEGLGLMSIPGKSVPYLGLNIVNYSNEGVRSEQVLNSKPVPGFADTGNFNTALRIPFINKDKNKIADNLEIKFYLQSNPSQIV
jgi:hypothetical protein